MTETLRAFIAVRFPDPLNSHLRGLQENLKSRGWNVRWVRPDNIHLTIKFLGNIETARVEPICCALSELCRLEAPLNLSLKGVGVFPGLKRPRVVWAGIGEGRDRLIALQRRVEDRLAAGGIKREARPFRAHLTLGRFRGLSAGAPPG